jgi:CRISPR-associated protein Cas2
MNVLVAYDVNTLTADGRRRLRKVAKACEGMGQRVQYSVFECAVNETQMAKLRITLLRIVDEDEDSLRFYFLRGPREEVVEAHGRDGYIDYQGPLIA